MMNQQKMRTRREFMKHSAMTAAMFPLLFPAGKVSISQFFIRSDAS
jgi:hypothetical protein